MFICQRCGKVSRPREKSALLPVEFKKWKFPFRAQVHEIRREGKIKYQDDPGGEGLQIVREIRVCLPCSRLKFADMGQWEPL